MGAPGWLGPGQFQLSSTSKVSAANGLATITAQKSGSNWTGGILRTDTTKHVSVRVFRSLRQASSRPRLLARLLAKPHKCRTATDELDIMEFMGGDVTHVYQTMHEDSGVMRRFHRRAQIGRVAPLVPNAVGARSGHLLYR